MKVFSLTLNVEHSGKLLIFSGEVDFWLQNLLYMTVTAVFWELQTKEALRCPRSLMWKECSAKTPHTNAEHHKEGEWGGYEGNGMAGAATPTSFCTDAVHP